MTQTPPEDRRGPRPNDAASLLTAIVTSSDDAIIGKDLDDIVTSWNASAERLFGFTAEEMIGQPVFKVIPPDRAEELRDIVSRVHRGERVTHFETERLTKDGRRIPVSVSISPVLDESGARIGISTITRDLTELQQMNQALRLREALLQSMVDIVPDALVVIDTRGVIQSFNPSAERAFGYAAAEVIGRNVSLLMPEPLGQAHDGYVERYLRTGERRIIGIGRIVLGRRKDGSTFPMELQIGEVDIAGAHLFVGFARDLTARQERERRMAELQAEVIHLSRLSELGHMVSAIAHEVNQPLAAIGNYIGGIRRLLTDDIPPVLRQAIERVAVQAERARDIVSSMRGLVKKEDRPRQTENLETLIRETSALALIGTNQTVGLDLRLSPDAMFGYVDKVQIQQVLLNLIRNAVEAMNGASASRLTIETVRMPDRVEFTVADTGPGLPDTVRERLFQPFVTTKPDGLGVGLSICRTIIEGHGGELTAESPPDGGTLFRFSVPAQQEAEGPKT